MNRKTPELKWVPASRKYYKDGELILEEDNCGNASYYFKGRYHRDRYPAVIRCNTKQWYHYGLRHRFDGPAKVNKNGHKEWYLVGHRFSEELFNVLTNILRTKITNVYSCQFYRLTHWINNFTICYYDLEKKKNITQSIIIPELMKLTCKDNVVIGLKGFSETPRKTEIGGCFFENFELWSNTIKTDKTDKQ